MKCVTVYTRDYEVFSDIYSKIMENLPAEDEEKEIDGITVSDSGELSEEYITRMRNKQEVAILKITNSDVILVQHGEVFEILIP
ncbi:MAG: NAD/NADP transhydrogenase alpha subunit [Bacilli bacterium]